MELSEEVPASGWRDTAFEFGSDVEDQNSWWSAGKLRDELEIWSFNSGIDKKQVNGSDEAFGGDFREVKLIPCSFKDSIKVQLVGFSRKTCALKDVVGKTVEVRLGELDVRVEEESFSSLIEDSRDFFRSSWMLNAEVGKDLVDEIVKVRGCARFEDAVDICVHECVEGRVERICCLTVDAVFWKEEVLGFESWISVDGIFSCGIDELVSGSIVVSDAKVPWPRDCINEVHEGAVSDVIASRGFVNVCV